MLLLDTGPIVAAANTADPDHTACARLLVAHPGPFIVTGLVVSEASYLLASTSGRPRRQPSCELWQPTAFASNHSARPT